MSKALKDCCSFQEGYVNPSQSEASYFGGDILWLRTLDLVDIYIDDTSQKLTQKGYESAGKSAKMFPENSIAINKSGTIIGAVSILKKPMCGNRAVIDIVVNPDTPLMYIYYLLKYKHGEVNKKAVGSIQKNLYVSALETIELTTDKYEEQKKIADILQSLDNKIFNNKKISYDLEAMAKLLYDYWFVQFDFPDENGKPYKSSGGKMVWNEELKREIPEEWKVGKVGDFISTERGISYGTPNIKTGEGIPMLNLATFMPGHGDYKADGLKHYLGEYPKNKVLKPFDLIMCNTQQTAIKFETDIIGRAMLVPDIFEGDVVFSHHVNVIRTKDRNLKYYLLFLFNSDCFHRYISGFTSGTSILGLSFNGVEDYLTVIPNSNVLERFGKLILEIAKTKSTIWGENQQLASLRDFLLPMLMNGQAKVGEQV